MRLLDRAEELLRRPRLRADRRARGLHLLAEGEKLLREHLALVATRASAIAVDLEARLLADLDDRGRTGVA